MKPPKTIFVCQTCGTQARKWLGRCPDCGAWNSMVEEQVRPLPEAADTARYGLATEPASAQLIDEIRTSDSERLTSGIGEFDRVRGGGIVPGSLVLLGGEHGIGKSTLLLQAASSVARSLGPVLYASGE